MSQRQQPEKTKKKESEEDITTQVKPQKKRKREEDLSQCQKRRRRRVSEPAAEEWRLVNKDIDIDPCDGMIVKIWWKAEEEWYRGKILRPKSKAPGEWWVLWVGEFETVALVKTLFGPNPKIIQPMTSVVLISD